MANFLAKSFARFFAMLNICNNEDSKDGENTGEYLEPAMFLENIKSKTMVGEIGSGDIYQISRPQD